MNWVWAAAFSVGVACGGAQEEPAEAAPEPAADIADTAGDADRADLAGEAETATPAGDSGGEARAESAAAGEEAPASVGEASDDFVVGIPVCDDYVRKYLACIEDRVPAEEREDMREAMRASADAWGQAAADPEARESLAEVCRQALEAAKQALSQYECEW